MTRALRFGWETEAQMFNLAQRIRRISFLRIAHPLENSSRVVRAVNIDWHSTLISIFLFQQIL
jgi:hypothetical protein